MKTLERKFQNFVLSRSSNEAIDSLPKALFPNKKADYLIYSRSLIFEMKSLVSDRGQVLNRKLSELANSEPDFPQFFGTVPIEDIIRAHKKSDEFRQWCLDFAGRTVRDNIKVSNTQLSDTKKALDIPRSTGVLVLLNDSIPLYDTEFIHTIVSKELSKIDSNGKYKRENVEIVWFINELNVSKRYTSSIIIDGPSLRNSDALTALEMLVTNWASFNHYAILSKSS